jgi:hypothetical protein
MELMETDSHNPADDDLHSRLASSLGQSRSGIVVVERLGMDGDHEIAMRRSSWKAAPAID